MEWEQKARAYYDDQVRSIKFLVPEELHVLEIGSGLGNLLAALRPVRGVDIELSPEMAKQAARCHPALKFRVDVMETLEIAEISVRRQSNHRDALMRAEPAAVPLPISSTRCPIHPTNGLCAYPAYPLRGGFDHPSLLPQWILMPMLRLEPMLERLGHLFTFRMLVVIERQS
jgi:SAM-dependent methyltransferase